MAPQLLVDLDGLQMSGSWGPPNVLNDWADITISASAFPFSGTIEAIFTSEDLVQFRDALSSMDVPGRVVLGGGRATYVALDVSQQIGVDPDRLTVEVTLIPSEDDGWPKLTYLIFSVDPAFGSRSAEAINEFVQSKRMPELPIRPS